MRDKDVGFCNASLGAILLICFLYRLPDLVNVLHRERFSGYDLDQKTCLGQSAPLSTLNSPASDRIFGVFLNSIRFG